MRIRILIDEMPFFDSGERDPVSNRKQLVRLLAHMWASLSDDDQALFFEEVARCVSGWEEPYLWHAQASRIGRHMAECECITDAGRGVLRELNEHLEAHAKERAHA